MNSSELLLYKNPENREVFDCMLRIASEEFEGLDVKKTAGRIVSHILEVSEKMGFNGNLWQDYLAYNLAMMRILTVFPVKEGEERKAALTKQHCLIWLCTENFLIRI